MDFLDDIDDRLRALGVDLDADDDIESDEVSDMYRADRVRQVRQGLRALESEDLDGLYEDPSDLDTGDRGFSQGTSLISFSAPGRSVMDRYDTSPPSDTRGPAPADLDAGDRFDSSPLRQRRRGTPVCTCNHGGDPAADLPAPLVPDGYRRGDDGAWRYVGGGLVPGAVDDCLIRRFQFARRPGGSVRIPQELCQRADLQWVRDHDPLDTAVTWHGRIVPALEVDRRCWLDHAYVPLGLLAPELLPGALLTTPDLALLTGMRPSTVTTYRSRGLLPTPQYVVSGTPLWSEPVVRLWMATRPST